MSIEYCRILTEAHEALHNRNVWILGQNLDSKIQIPGNLGETNPQNKSSSTVTVENLAASPFPDRSAQLQRIHN